MLKGVETGDSRICVWYWFIFLPYVSPFKKKKRWRVISIDVSTKHHVIKAERAETKSGNGAVGYRRKLPSVAIIFLRDIIFFLALVMLTLPGYDKNKTK